MFAQDHVPSSYMKTCDDDSSYKSDQANIGEMQLSTNLRDSVLDISINSQGSDMANTTGSPNGDPLPKSAFDEDIEKLMTEVNQSLEYELKEMKKTTERMLKELVAFSKTAKSVHATLTQVLESEQQESIRLEKLHSEIQGSFPSFPKFNGNDTNDTDTFTK